ncbi:hypothetical protein C5167_021281 [Papaver somniferum]|uniref:RRM domain-containing protein n=1 Tax=Papaver somniferum TaxID=3469 RepID=A0A4Y7IW42_PAPSO|nr:uncharacterized protein LOC113354537 [Papaver somniferum]RZC52857.1 hypothetical protein C5167_021281 [Papaver somniferum]
MTSYHDEKMTIEELRFFYRIDREIYRYLAITLGKDPLRSMAIIALWISMEEMGYPSIILELLTYQSDIITNSACDEAEWAVYYIITGTPPPPPFYRTAVTDMNTTLTLIRDSGSAMYVSMKYLFEHGAIGYSSLKQIIGNLCSIMFADILRKAMLKNGFGDNPNDLVNDRADEDTNIPEVELDNSAPIKVEAGSSSGTTQGENISEFVRTSSFLTTFEEQPTVEIIPPCKRTLFVIFSRGFPISEDQIREFLVRTNGENCVESICMQQVRPPQRRQPMYAMIEFHATETIDKILAGEDKVRFFISGCHIQARRLEAREG